MIRSAGYCENYTICSCRPTHVGRGLKCVMCENLLKRYPSPHACGAWIEVRICPYSSRTAPSPHACGAWIEVLRPVERLGAERGRPTHVGRGLKLQMEANIAAVCGRPTHVGRGLKSASFLGHHGDGGVAPRMWGVD